MYVKDERYGKIWSLSPNLNQDEGKNIILPMDLGIANFKIYDIGLLQEQERLFLPKIR